MKIVELKITYDDKGGWPIQFKKANGAFTSETMNNLIVQYRSLRRPRRRFVVRYSSILPGWTEESVINWRIKQALFPDWSFKRLLLRDLYENSQIERVGIADLRIVLFRGPSETSEAQILRLRDFNAFPADSVVASGPIDCNLSAAKELQPISVYRFLLMQDMQTAPPLYWTLTEAAARRATCYEMQRVVGVVAALSTLPFNVYMFNDLCIEAHVGWWLLEVDRLRLVGGILETCRRIRQQHTDEASNKQQRTNEQRLCDAK